MSDYFGALMKSSGLTVGTGGPARLPVAQASKPIPADYGIEEVEDRHIVVPTESTELAAPAVSAGHVDRLATPLQTLANPQQGFVTPKPGIIEQPTIATPPVWNVEEQAGKAASGFEEKITVRRDSVITDGSGVKHTLSARVEPLPNLPKAATSPSLVMVQAAMHWVANGGKANEAVPSESSASAPQFVSSDLSGEASRGDSAEAPAGKPTTEGRAEAFFKPPTAEQIAYSQREESLASIRTPADISQVPAASLATEDMVEITIGSIHVRVDAPPPPPVALTAPRTVPEPPPRSGFSRRALWRI